VAGNSKDRGRSVISKISAILLTAAEGSGYTLTEIATRSELPLSTVHRLVGELAAWGLMAALAGCAWGDPNSTYPEYQKSPGHGPTTSTPPQSVFGGEGLTLFSTDKPKNQDDGGGGGIG